MQLVDFNNLEPQETLNHTSKGNQLKWKYDGYWYKADHMGYEGLAESIVSALLEKSSIKYPFVKYEYSKILYHGRTYNGCRSENFILKNSRATLIPLEKLYRSYTGGSLAIDTAKQGDVQERIKFLVDFVEKHTGIRDFGPYLTAMLEVDAFFLNEDRHTNNIAVLYDDTDETYSLCPLFDNGLSLLSDTSLNFPLERPLEDCLQAIEAKPFSRHFDDQLDAAEGLYGIQLRFSFGSHDVKDIIDAFRSEYDNDICNRCEALIRRQMHHYSYLIQK